MVESLIIWKKYKELVFKFFVIFINNYLNKFFIGFEKYNNYYNDFVFLLCWKLIEEL